MDVRSLWVSSGKSGVTVGMLTETDYFCTDFLFVGRGIKETTESMEKRHTKIGPKELTSW